MDISFTDLSQVKIKDLVEICGVDVTTARRWRRGAIRPPAYVLALLNCKLRGDLSFIDPAWRNWSLRNGHLISPEGWEISMNDILATQLKDAQIRAYQDAVRRLRYELSEAQRGGYEDQPTPADWDVKIING